MPIVIVTCPDRRGVHNGYYSAIGHFGEGDTRIELTAEQLEVLQGEIDRKESILSVRPLTAAERAAEEKAKAEAAQKAADDAELARLEAEEKAKAEASSGKKKGAKE